MVGPKASAEVDRPLARDIVRYFDIAYLATLEIGSDNVIRVDVPTRPLAFLVYSRERCIPFSTLQVTHSIR